MQRARPSGRVRIGHQGCCSINDAADARLSPRSWVFRSMCATSSVTGRVIGYFVDEYASGRTPNPCVRCNDWLKFGKLHDYARQIGADFVASGHYARSSGADGGERGRQRGEGLLAARGVDSQKDQSYVLFGVPRELLCNALPIGGLPAPRPRWREFGLRSDKPDSQENLFVPDNDYAAG